MECGNTKTNYFVKKKCFHGQNTKTEQKLYRFGINVIVLAHKIKLTHSFNHMLNAIKINPKKQLLMHKCELLPFSTTQSIY